jgi:thiamine biosynthesis lipoprotein
MKIPLTIAPFLLILYSYSNINFKKHCSHMGSKFEIIVVAKDSIEGKKFVEIAEKEINRIESLISSWNTKSETSLINQNAGIKPVKVSYELYRLIERSILISRITDGAFDLTFSSASIYWRFNGVEAKQIPYDKIRKSIKKINYKNIILDKKKKTVFLRKKGMKIGFGANGKGYAADKAKAALQQLGVKGGIINASGDISTWGTKANGNLWTFAIKNPFDKTKNYGMFPVKNKAIVTSGDYEKFILINGIRHSHIINPKTGMPTKGIVSATVFAPKAEVADALATSIFVLGIEVGLDRINQIREVEAIVVDDKGKVHCSDNIFINNQKDEN